MKLKDLVIVIVMMKMIVIPQDNSKEINLYLRSTLLSVLE